MLSPILHSVLIAPQTARGLIVNGGLEKTGDASVAVVHPLPKTASKGAKNDTFCPGNERCPVKRRQKTAALGAVFGALSTATRLLSTYCF